MILLANTLRVLEVPHQHQVKHCSPLFKDGDDETRLVDALYVKHT